MLNLMKNFNLNEWIRSHAKNQNDLLALERVLEVNKQPNSNIEEYTIALKLVRRLSDLKDFDKVIRSSIPKSKHTPEQQSLAEVQINFQ